MGKYDLLDLGRSDAADDVRVWLGLVFQHRLGHVVGPDNRLVPPAGCSIDVIGVMVTPPQVSPNGVPVPGAVIDAGFHVNAAWHARPMPEAFLTSVVVPTIPKRVLSLPETTQVEPPVPTVIPAWKGKAALREAGFLDAVETAVSAAGGRIQDAWIGASEWSRDSEFLSDLAGGLGMSADAIDRVFRDADAIQS